MIVELGRGDVHLPQGSASGARGANGGFASSTFFPSLCKACDRSALSLCQRLAAPVEPVELDFVGSGSRNQFEPTQQYSAALVGEERHNVAELKRKFE
jgi:hypothetical protein